MKSDLSILFFRSKNIFFSIKLKYKILFIINIFLSLNINIYGQKTYNDFVKEYAKMKPEAIDNYSMADRVRVYENIWRNKGSKDYKYVNSAADTLVNILIDIEKPYLYEKEIYSETRKCIEYIQDPYGLVLLYRAIKNYEFRDQTILTIQEFETFKEKIIKDVNQKTYILNKNKYPFYTYESSYKKMLKFIYIKHGNDLLQFTQRNLDREYTGSLKIELATDYLNPIRRRPLNTYQTFILGLDVYTPYFKNPKIFDKPDAFNENDRPHAAFQYLGWGKYGLSKNESYRWATNVKIGSIGKKGGEKFQSLLHRDFTNSYEPMGWDAQIANGGRMAISIEEKFEYQFKTFIERLYIQPYVDVKWGSFMTTGSLGITLTNRKFLENNHHNINHRIKQNISFLGEHLKYFVSFNFTGVLHNTMLEGFGFIKTLKKEGLDISNYTPNIARVLPTSKHILKEPQINRCLNSFNIGLSYTTSYATLSYNWINFSPETHFGENFINDEKLKLINISNRRHHIGEITLSLNIK